MSITIRCPDCGLRYSVRDGFAGKKVKCHHGHVFIVATSSRTANLRRRRCEGVMPGKNGSSPATAADTAPRKSAQAGARPERPGAPASPPETPAVNHVPDPPPQGVAPRDRAAWSTLKNLLKDADRRAVRPG